MENSKMAYQTIFLLNVNRLHTCFDFIKLILGWPKSSFGVFHNILQKNPSKPFGQPSIC